MSRNLGARTCQWCGGEVVMLEDARPITPEDCGIYYFHEYEGMLVANAHCKACEAPYLAWVIGIDRYSVYIRDLSFRSTFNDTPGPSDFPKYAVRPWTLEDSLASKYSACLSDADKARAEQMLATASAKESHSPEVIALAREMFVQQCTQHTRFWLQEIADDPEPWRKTAQVALTAAEVFVAESRKGKP